MTLITDEYEIASVTMMPLCPEHRLKRIDLEHVFRPEMICYRETGKTTQSVSVALTNKVKGGKMKRNRVYVS